LICRKFGNEKRRGDEPCRFVLRCKAKQIGINSFAYGLYPNDCVPAGRFNVADIGLTTDFIYPSTENFGKRIGQ
jgi:hypothetical protein